MNPEELPAKLKALIEEFEGTMDSFGIEYRPTPYFGGSIKGLKYFYSDAIKACKETLEWRIKQFDDLKEKFDEYFKESESEVKEPGTEANMLNKLQDLEQRIKTLEEWKEHQPIIHKLDEQLLIKF